MTAGAKTLPLFESAWPVAGIDEVGRGPLAGPVVAAAVILPKAATPDGLHDSKKLSAARREELDAVIRRDALAWAIGAADVAEIDALNILNATLLAMRRAVAALPVWPASIAVDGNRLPDLGFHSRSVAGEAIVGGDGTVASISAASIVAKVYRDGLMAEADRRFPGFGFAANKGYGTAGHLDALRRLGPCAIHRRSFRPVRDGLTGLLPRTDASSGGGHCRDGQAHARRLGQGVRESG